jgi:hypothetical protein
MPSTAKIFDISADIRFPRHHACVQAWSLNDTVREVLFFPGTVECFARYPIYGKYSRAMLYKKYVRSALLQQYSQYLSLLHTKRTL